MTLAQRIRQEGREEGREEGMRRAIWVLLEARFQSCPEGLLEELRQIKGLERLEALHRYAISCASLEEFPAGLTGGPRWGLPLFKVRGEAEPEDFTSP